MAKIIPAEEKVFMVSKSTNTTYSGSAALKAMSEWYTMEDVVMTVAESIPVTPGVTEIVAGDGISIDQGTGVVTITNEVTVPYKVFTALLNQNGPNYTIAPTITILENTLDPSITITGTSGQYQINSPGNEFGSRYKCFTMLGSNRAAANTGGTAGKIITNYNNSNTITLWAMNDAIDAFVTGYGLFLNLAIEIRVYN